MENWHTRLLGLFARAYPRRNAISDPDLIRVFCLGLKDDKVLYETRSQNCSTYREALRAAQRIVATLEEIRAARRNNGDSNATIGQVNALSEKEAKCFDCGEIGHFFRNCSKNKKNNVRRSFQKGSGQRSSSRRTDDKKRAGKGKPKLPFNRNIKRLVAALSEGLEGSEEEDNDEDEEVTEDEMVESENSDQGE